MRDARWLLEKAPKQAIEPRDAANVGDVALPRPYDTFQTGQFGPGVPINPFQIDRPSDGGPAEPRLTEYMPGWNYGQLPGFTKLVPFQLLRATSKMVLPVWRAIDVRKAEISSMEWDIVLLPEYHDQKGSGVEDVRKQLIEFFSHPDPEEGLSISDWVKMAEEEISVIDALSVYLRPTRSKSGGILGSGLHSLQILDGTLIKPLRDIRGGRPRPPAPAFQQYLYGAPRADLMAPWLPDELGDGPRMMDGEVNAAVRNFRANQIIYKPFHRLSWTPYGFSETESCLNEIKLWIDREKYHQAYFDQSDMPAMFLPAPADWGPTQIDEYQRKINMQMGGDPGWKHRIKVIPSGGGNMTQVRPHLYDLTFDEYLIRIISMAYSISPESMNLSPKSGLGGGGWAEESTRRQLRIAVRPRLIYLAEIFNFVMHNIIGERRFAFRWLSLSQQDLLQKAQIDNIYSAGGLRPRNEIREENGWNRADEPEANMLLVTTRSGIVTLGAASINPNPEVQPPAAVHEPAATEADDLEEDDEGIGNGAGDQPTTEVEEDQQRQRARQKALLRELGQIGSHLLKHVSRPFYPVVVPDEVLDAMGQVWLSRPPEVGERDWVNKILTDARVSLDLED